MPTIAGPDAGSRVERAALSSLARLAYATTHERGDIYVGRAAAAGGGVRLEAWAREVGPDVVDGRVPARLRADAESVADEVGARLEVLPDPAGRKIVFRIDLPARGRRR